MNRRHFVTKPVTAHRRRRPGRLLVLTSWIGAVLVIGAATAAGQSGFSLGVAAGDVSDTAAILWTRPDWLSVVRYELARDEGFAAIEQSGIVLASPENDFVVKVEVTGLSPATEYFYRFAVEGDADRVSRVGRFRTAPAPDEAAALRFVFTGDTGFTFAPFPIVSQAAREEADFLLWFGDTIYADDPAAVTGIATTLAEYRQKYREIRSDPYFQEALAALPLWVGWDDHEVTDNYAGADPAVPAEQLEAAYQAFFAYMPIQEQQIPEDPFRTYRRFRWGRQVEFFLLDGRQYREASAEAACRSNPDPLGTVLGPLLASEACAAQLSEERTLLGGQQLDWLTRGLVESTAEVKFVVNDVPLSYIGLLPYDRWDGYDAERRALLEFIDAHEISGVIFLTTDFHSNWYNPDLLRYFRRRRGDYQLTNEVTVVEAIVGPGGVPPLHETVVALATTVLGRPNGPALRSVLTGIERHVTGRLQCVSGFTLVETNRVSYAVVEVSPGGKVAITYRGLAPADAHDPNVVVETFYAAHDDRPPTLPCCLPVLLVALAGWPALAARRKRAAR
ncbi:MAG: alkaline phosphatase D family protein [Phycisphaerae bacterium]